MKLKIFLVEKGGAILINNANFIEKAEIIREKGTERSKFFRGQVDKYTWVDLGSSFLPSDILAAYLYPQLLGLERINASRKSLWTRYYNSLKELETEGVKLPICPKSSEHNAHMFYLRLPSFDLRTKFISYMKNNGINCAFHYIPLHSSPAGNKFGRFVGNMRVTDNVAATLVRLPMFYGLENSQQDYIIDKILSFCWR